ncbi:MAG: heparinase [Zoogloea sp.]|nr:MAG: heparinase [Zoogloea sp.]
MPAELPATALARADEVLGGVWRIFARGPLTLGFPPEWNRNPDNGALLPMVFGKTMAFRDTSTSGDIKYLWEPNRHLELVLLAQAWRATGKRPYLDAIGVLLDSWFAQCPYPLGPNWASALEAGIRLINWATVWQIIGGADAPLFADAAGDKLRRRWLDSIWRHASFIRGHRSLHSSANNHLIGELAGLFVASITWPCWPEAGAWEAAARSGLEREILRQNSADGVNLEQATSYQQFVWDFLLFARLTARAAGRDFTPAFAQRMEAMLEYVAGIMDAGGHVPMFGDADDGLASGLSLGAAGCPFRSQLATGAVLFRRADLARKAGQLDLRSRWLLGATAQDTFDALLQDLRPATPRNAFPGGGIYVLGAALDTPDEIRVVADAAPLGLGGIAAHGHADALSFTLSLAGREFLVDPGTGTYHGPRSWRDGFRGTAMHNTLTLAGEDQAITGGKFMWVRKYHCTVLDWSSSAEADALVAEHDGYRRLPGQPVHRRSWHLDKAKGLLRVRDEVVGDSGQAPALHWHFAEGCEVRQAGEGLTITHDGVGLHMELPPDGEVRILCASEAPFAGWVSRAYDQRSASTTVIWQARSGSAAPLETLFRRI